jgi:hypothetical protein
MTGSNERKAMKHEEQMGNRHDGTRVTAPLFAFDGFQHTEPNRLYIA